MNKRLLYGTLSTVMLLVAVAVFVFVNLVAGQFNVTKDLTENEMFSLSSYTEEFAAELETDVTIYALMPTGQENILLSQLLDEYAALSPRITVEKRDPTLYPGFVEQYADEGTSIANNSVIVESANRFKIVPPTDMITFETDYTTGQQTPTAINFESQISKAIHYVSLTDTPTAYHVNGSNEMTLSANLTKQFELEGYGFNTVDLVLGEIPEDCDMLIITTPERDWTAEEAAKVLAYLQNEGRAMFLLSPTLTRFANLDGVLAAYGVRTGDYLVLEGSADHYTANNPQYLVPEFVSNEITDTLRTEGYRSFFVQATGIDELDVKKTSTEIAPFIVTSNDAYGRVDTSLTTVNRADSDLPGPFNLGVTVTDTYFADDSTKTTKMVVFGSEMLANDSANEMIGGTNFDVIISGLNWLYEQPASIYIPSKSPAQVSQLSLTQTDANMMMLAALIVIPLVFVAAGVTVWYRRRHS